MSVSPESINQALARHWPAATCRCLEVSAEHAVAELEVAPTEIRPGGFVSGPAQFGIADAALWFLVFGALGRPEPMALTTELSIRFLRPAVGKRLHARANLERRGRSQLVGTIKVWAGDEVHRPCAVAQGTYALPSPTPG